MNNKLLLILLAVFCISVSQSYAQMSDAQIIAYLTEGVAAGKSESQLGSELLAKGVSASQIQRLLKQYKTGSSSQFGSSMPKKTNKFEDLRPTRKIEAIDEDDLNVTGYSGESKGSKTSKGQKMGDMYDDFDSPKAKTNLKKRELKDSVKRKEHLFTEDGFKIIFGQNMFQNRKLSFEPNENAATPSDYVLGPGDEVVIDIWGSNEATISEVISPEGRIFISQVGPLVLSGLTIKEAGNKIKNALSRIYGALEGRSSDISISLGQVRTIQVNILGEVNVPGTYRLSPFTTVFNAIYRAGGITTVGSLRTVNLIRNGKEISSVDIYDYLFNGKSEVNISLKEGDVIVVPPYVTLASIDGGVKRPMFYELKKGETVSDLVRYAGGLTGDACLDNICVERMDGKFTNIFTVSEANYSTFELIDCDALTVGMNKSDLYSNMVEVKGAVYRPGKYQLGGGIATVRQLVEYAGGLLDDAFVGRAQIVREKADRSLEIVSIALKGIMESTVPDVALRKNDVLMVSNVNEIIERGDLSITGYVVNPGDYQFAEHTTVEDLILLAGGLSDGASSVRVDVSRRIKNPSSTEASDTIATVYTFGIKDGLVEDGTSEFFLEPFDVVAVRRSPTYIEQRNVTVTGEVTFPGQYTLLSTNERVSDLIRRAGGPTDFGYIHGAMLKRKINQYERNVRVAMAKMVKQGSGRDSIDIKKVMVSEVYTVGLELDKAIEHPGSDYDVVLRDGDELVVPENTSTVRVQGEVLYPNTVHYISGKNLNYYIHQSGGYSNRARRAKVYVVYMNGTVAVGQSAKLEPGCEIIVPNRRDREKMSTSEWLSIGTSTASIATMIATLVNTLRR